MDLYPEHRRQQGFAQQVAGSIKPNPQEKGSAHFLDGRDPVFFFRIHFNPSTDQAAAVTGPRRIPFPHLVQEGRGKDGKDIGNGQYGNGKGIIVGRFVPSDAFIDLGQRHSAGPVAAPHNGQHIIQQHQFRRDPKEQAPGNPQDGSPDEAPENGRQVSGKRPEEQFLFQSQHRSADQEHNEEAEEIRLIHDHPDTVFIGSGNVLVGEQVSRNHKSQDQTPANVRVPHRDPFPDFIAHDTQSQHEGKASGQVGAQRTGHNPGKYDQDEAKTQRPAQSERTKAVQFQR